MSAAWLSTPTVMSLQGLAERSPTSPQRAPKAIGLTPKPRLAGPRFQAFVRGRLLRPSRAVPVVLAGCVLCSDTISNYHSAEPQVHMIRRSAAVRPVGARS